MPFIEFCCRSGGNNMNGGALGSGAEPATSPVYSTTNGNWNGTVTFTPTDSSTPASTVSVGDWAGVFNDGATTPVYVARVTAVAAGANGAITLSASQKAGTAPTSSATGRSIRVGGAWAGPSGAVTFPFGFVAGSTMIDNSTTRPRFNFKNDQTYNMTASMVHGNAGPDKFQGYTTTFGDGGRATFDGGTSGTSYILLSVTSSYHGFEDFIFQNNGATGSADLAGASVTNAYMQFRRCVFAHARGSGFANVLGIHVITAECEAYDCNQSNTALKGGFDIQLNQTVLRCISHDHSSGANGHGFVASSSNAFFMFIECIADTCGGKGFNLNTNQSGYRLLGCDAYNCTSDGIGWTTGGGITLFYIENCNLVKNGGWGINIASGGDTAQGWVVNCGFGSGSQANTSGQVNTGGGVDDLTEVLGSVTYASGVTPWVDPANGDFRVNLAAAKGAGRGSFTQTAASYTGTVGFPDIGAAQHLDSGGGSTGPVGELKQFGRGAPY